MAEMNPAIRSALISVKVRDRSDPERVTHHRQTVAAISSVPRLGWTDHWSACFRGLGPFGIPLNIYTGVYWDHCLERCLESCRRSEVEWALCLDYDTVFGPSDVNQMLGLMAAYPEADAIAAIQAKRGADTLLATLDDEQKAMPPDGCIGQIRPVASAHFGFTILRVGKLRGVTKPWFEHRPGPDGGWNEGRVDSDVNFWTKWRAAGNTIYLASEIRVGHLQVMATYPDPETFKPIHQYPGDALKGLAANG